MKIIPLVSACFLWVSFSVYADHAAPVADKENFTDPGKTLIVSENKANFNIKLRSNPTTGYSWVLQADYNHHLLETVSHRFQSSSTKLVGAPGSEEFVFKVDDDAFRVPQITHLTFQYVRPWVVTAAPKTMTFTVVTQPNKN